MRDPDGTTFRANITEARTSSKVSFLSISLGLFSGECGN